MLAQSRDDFLAEELDAPHRRLVRLLAFARPEGQVAGIGTVDNVLEFLDDGSGAAGDDQAGANGGLVAAFGHPPLPGHIACLGLFRHVAGRRHPLRMRPAARRAGRAGSGGQRRGCDTAAAPDDGRAAIMVAAHLVAFFVGIHHAGMDQVAEVLWRRHPPILLRHLVVDGGASSEALIQRRRLAIDERFLV